MSPENPKRMDDYVRVSGKGTREGASFQSPEQQRAAISGWAPSKGIEIAERDDGISRWTHRTMSCSEPIVSG